MSQAKRALFDSIAGVEQLEQLCSKLDFHQLATRLVDGGVITRDEFDSVVHDLEVPVDELNTTLVADALVRTRRVSMYQLWTTISGRQDELSLGEYTVVEPLGAGGMGEVLLSVHRRMKRKVAIKFLPAHFADDQEMIKRFEREVEVAAQLSHPNIVTAYDAGHTGDTHYLVMEYVNGCDLGSLIRESGPLAVNDALKCVLQAGKGIAHAHEQGIIHRDIKPSNLLADRNGTIKVLDMGLARWSNAAAQSAASDLSITGAVMGTVDFMSPEQAASGKNADTRSDTYSLGCTLFMLIQGRPVFPGETVIEKIVAHQNAEIPDLVQGDDERFGKLNQIFRRMLAKKPEERFATIDGACAALAECLDDNSQDLKVSLSIPDRMPPRSLALQDTRDKLPEASFISTMGFSDEIVEGQRSPEEQPKGKWRGIGIVAIVALLLAGAGALGVPMILKLATRDGTLVVKCYVQGAIVEVDGKEMIRVTDPDSRGEYRFDLPKGEHKVRAMLPDGTEIKSGTIMISNKEDTLFEVLRKETQRGRPQVAATDQGSTPDVDDDPNVLTVAQDGSAEFTSIGDAINKAISGNVIRILDNGEYRETVMLSLISVHEKLTIEASQGATWIPGNNYQAAMYVQNVKNVTLRSLNFDLDRPGVYGIVASQATDGLRIEDCRFTSRSPGASPAVSLESVSVTVEPVFVHNCDFNGVPLCLQVSGLDNNNQPVSCGGVLITGCRFSRSSQAINISGQAHDVTIAENQFHNVAGNGVQFMHLAGDLENILVANNTFLECRAPIRIWENGFKPASISIVANLSLTQGMDDWFALDSGGDPFNSKGPAHGTEYATGWNFTHNFREGRPPEKSNPVHAGWFPPGELNNLVESIELLSRDPDNENFLRPPPQSAVATGGFGGELPAHAGAVPPDRAEPFDWDRAFQRSLVLSRVPDDVITVAKKEVAHCTTLRDALQAVKPGMTVRVIDDATYEEIFTLDDPARFEGITLEATSKALLQAADEAPTLVTLRRATDVTIRGFRVALGSQTMTGILVTGACPGLTLEGLAFEPPQHRVPGTRCISLEWHHGYPRKPIVVSNCEIQGTVFGIVVSGLLNNYDDRFTCENIAIVNNRIVNVGTGILLMGDVRHALLAGNSIRDAGITGIQFEQTDSESTGVVVVNNSISRSRFGIRVWSDNNHGKGHSLINNLTFECGEFDWSYFDNGGTREEPRGPGDIDRLLSDWTITSNIREGNSDPPTGPFSGARVPSRDGARITGKIDLASRSPANSDYARPAVASPLASEGAGGVYPSYIGSIPPANQPPFDWQNLIDDFFTESSAK
jgi:serine/threonine protein kinase